VVLETAAASAIVKAVAAIAPAVRELVLAVEKAARLADSVTAATCTMPAPAARPAVAAVDFTAVEVHAAEVGMAVAGADKAVARHEGRFRRGAEFLVPGSNFWLFRAGLKVENQNQKIHPCVRAWFDCGLRNEILSGV
jgi:hypothetical protein